jgi:hypothetical protein
MKKLRVERKPRSVPEPLGYTDNQGNAYVFGKKVDGGGMYTSHGSFLPCGYTRRDIFPIDRYEPLYAGDKIIIVTEEEIVL